MEKTLKTKPRVISLTVAIVGFVIVVLTVIVGWVVLPKLIESLIKKNTQIVENSYIWDKWADIPIPILFKLYFFNVTNPDDYMGKPLEELDWSIKPILKEVGPYTFKQKRIKYGFRDGPDDSLFFRENVTFFFSPEDSGKGLSEEDTLTLLNVAMIAGISILDVNRILDPIAPLALDSVLHAPDNAGMFTDKYKIIDLMFRGHKLEPVYQSVSTFAKWFGITIPDELKNGEVAFYRGKNGTNGEGEWSVYRGRKDHEQFNLLRSVSDGKKNLTPWWEDECAKFKGTDGSMFPPFLKKDRRLYMYRPEVCRTIYFDYDSEVDYEGISAYRFTLPKSLFEGPHVNPENKCFWRDVWPPLNNDHNFVGISRLFSCKENFPLFLSKPYFLDSEGFVLQEAKERYGMIADREKHDSYMDLEPNIGFPLRARVRLQLGIEMQRFRTLTVKPLDTIPHSFFPLVWLEMEAELNDELKEELHSKFVTPMKIMEITKWVLLGIGTVMTLAGTGFFAYNWSKA